MSLSCACLQPPSDFGASPATTTAIASAAADGDLTSSCGDVSPPLPMARSPLRSLDGNTLAAGGGDRRSGGGSANGGSLFSGLASLLTSPENDDENSQDSGVCCTDSKVRTYVRQRRQPGREPVHYSAACTTKHL